MVERNGRIVSWRRRDDVPLDPSIDPNTDHALEKRMAELMLWKLLMERNWGREPPPGAITVPMVIIGLTDPASADVVQDMHSGTLKVRAPHGEAMLISSLSC
jgi:hypothetical protein